MLPFLLIVLAIVGSLCWYMASRTLALSPLFARHPAWVYGFFIAFLGLQFCTPLMHRIPFLTHRLDGLYWITYGLMSLVSMYFVFLVGSDLVQWVARRWFHAPTVFGQYALFAAMALASLSTLLGLINVLMPVPLHRVEVPIADLPPQLDGFRIVQISDLHLGPMAREDQVTRIAALTRAQRPDLVAITGDLVDSEADGTRAKAALLRDLGARHGVCFITGNHEYYSGASRWLELFRSFGWHVLQNGHEVMDHDGASLVVIGMPDPAARFGRAGSGSGPDLDLALAGAPAQGTRILLFHQPLGYREAEAADVKLQLSGHTHGGQYFPWTLLVRRIFAHPVGLHAFKRMWIYTSPGTGFWGPPNRFMMPPELTLLTLKRID